MTNTKNSTSLFTLGYALSLYRQDVSAFDVWVTTLSKNDRLQAWSACKHGIYRRYDNTPLELIRDFLPEEVSHTKYHKNGDIVVHEFKFELLKYDSSFKLSYTHVAEHYLNKEEGGLTNTWCNPFEDNHACNHLIFVICNIDNMQESIIKLYEFLINNDIEFIDNTK